MAFATAVDKWIKAVRKTADESAQFYFERGGLFLVDITPVVTGKLVGGWYPFIGEPNEVGALPSLPVDPRKIFTPSIIKAATPKVTWGVPAGVQNDVAYSYWVDQGWSRANASFSGHHMIERTLTYLKNLEPPKMKV